jgi:hypothetical protein
MAAGDLFIKLVGSPVLTLSKSDSLLRVIMASFRAIRQHNEANPLGQITVIVMTDDLRCRVLAESGVTASEPMEDCALIRVAGDSYKLVVRATHVGCELAAMLSSGIDGRKTVWLHDDGSSELLQWVERGQLPSKLPEIKP